MTPRLVYLALITFLCLPVWLPAQTRPTTSFTASPAEQASHDHFVGWYRLPARSESGKVMGSAPAIFIPILKRSDSYYSVCRFAEVPLKVIPDGLEWGIEPSSMKGTKITFDPQKKEYAITISDSRDQSDSGMQGMPQPMQKVDAPFATPNTTTAAPQTNEDFVGWYEALWLPQLRYHITRNGEKFILEGKIIGRDNNGQPPAELRPLANALGFQMDPRGKSQIIYNQDLNRYEITGVGAPVHMPLKRSDTEPADPPTLPGVARIGIPSWN